MKFSSLMVLRPFCVLATLAIVLLLIPSLGVLYWYPKVKRIEVEVRENSEYLRAELISKVENSANLLNQFNSSALNLARDLSSSLHGTNIIFSTIVTRIAPSMYQTLLTLPFVSQISYIESDGLFFSYYWKNGEPFAVYSNTSFAFNSSWYTRHINRATGKMMGATVVTPPAFTVNSTWFKEALNATHGSYNSFGHRWNSEEQELVALNSASVSLTDGKRAVLSIGYNVKVLSSFFLDMEFYGGNFLMATKDGQMILDNIADTRMVVVDAHVNSVSLQLLKPNNATEFVGSISCNANVGGTPSFAIVEVVRNKYHLHCSRFSLIGVESVYILAIPFKGLGDLVHKYTTIGFIVQLLLVVLLVIAIIIIMWISSRAAKREMYLCGSLIKQMESTRQAERKHMNKNRAVANANHDVRTSLAGLTALIDLSYPEVSHGFVIEMNLRKMETCCKDLWSLLNSILDTNKIEAGKMDLNEESFDIAELLEDVVDMYHPVGMKKGVDVILDPCDGSVLKNAQVKGDRAKLKQILWNLLSNAVKFTVEGSITLRATAKKPSFEQSILASHRNGFLCYFSSCLFFKRDDDASETTVTAVQHNPDAMEFVFKVDDTGKGVPKEKQQSVFDNYVQVKESCGVGGTGLGLGIVQSLVRLMGGEIAIVDKDSGEKGTCLKFNVFLTTDDHRNHDEEDIETQANCQHQQPYGRLMRIFSTGPRFDGQSSHVVLMIKSDARRKVVTKFMIESLGLQVSAVKQCDKEDLADLLKKIKRKLRVTNCSSSGLSDFNSRSEVSCDFGVGAKDVPLSTMDGDEYVEPVYRKRINRLSFVLLVIEASLGPFSEICRLVYDFKNDLRNGSHGCKIVWLDNPVSRIIGEHSQKSLISLSDHVITQPFHGSQIFEVLRFLPEFGGQDGRNSTESGDQISLAQTRRPFHIRTRSKPSAATPSSHGRWYGEILECGSTSGSDEIRSAREAPKIYKLVGSNGGDEVMKPRDKVSPENRGGGGGEGGDKPLHGKKVLVVEDSNMLRRVAEINLSQLGTTVESCENGKEALDLVCKGLKDAQKTPETSMIPPYDYIFMDCEMPVMDGYEATILIRVEELKYGVYMPIIALSAHSLGAVESKKIAEAGMDYHLPKPVSKEKLLEAISAVRGQ